MVRTDSGLLAVATAREFRCDDGPTIGMLAVAGGKGGCGKTTTALGVARALASVGGDRDPPVLVADADRDMPDLHTLAGVERTPTLADAIDHAGARDDESRDRAEPLASVSQAVEAVDAPGVRVLPAPEGIAGRPTVEALSALRRRIAVVDCPAGAGPDAVAPLRVADSVLLVARATGESLRDALKTAAMARQLDCTPVGAVLTRTDSVPGGVRSGLDVTDAWAIPEAAGAPLRDTAVQTAYRRVVRAVVG